MTLERLHRDKKRGSVDVSRSRRARSKVSSTTGGGGSSIFDTVATLDEQDDNVPLTRRRGTENDDDDDDMSRRQRQTAAVQAQTNIYSKLMECRIVLQRSHTPLLSSSLPPPDDAPSSNNNSNNEDFTDAALHQCDTILIQLLEARRLLSQPPPPRNNANNDEGKEEDDPDDSMDVDVVDYGTLIKESPVAFQEQLQKEYEQHRDQWKEVLNRRHYHVQLHSGVIQQKKFNMIDTSFWHLVQSTLQHLQLRHNHHKDHQNDGTTATTTPFHHRVGYQPFDDSKIYQQMLKDFVETASSNTTTDFQDTAGIRKRRTKSSNNQNNSSAMVDRKASKGRKIRYTTMTKLTNFTFPQQRRHTVVSSSSSSTNNNNILLDEDAWFRSLFGGT